MLTVNKLNNQQNINFMSTKKSIATRMLDSYHKYNFPLRTWLVKSNGNEDFFYARLSTLTLAGIAALAVNLGVGTSDYKNCNRKVEVKNTEVLQNREKELDEQYKAGTLLLEEYISGLENVRSDYKTLGKETAKKLDNVVQKRIEHSDLKSIYNVNPKTGKYDYTLSVNYPDKAANISVNNPK